MILASRSPRRIALMQEAGCHCRSIPADIDETPLADEQPIACAERLARLKALAVAGCAQPQELVLGADTVVVCEGDLLGKPHDEADAQRMLKRLSDRTHLVATGVYLYLNDEQQMGFSEITEVEFYPLSDEQIARYVATGEPLDKAGAYGIQGTGGRMFVKSIHGDFYNVVGLPIARIAHEVSRFGIQLGACL